MSAALSLHKARTYVAAAIKSLDTDPKLARVDLIAAERVLSEALAEYTPVQPVATEDVRKAHESSSGFKAVGQIFDEAKRGNPSRDEP